MPPTALTPPNTTGAITAFHLEKALVQFITQLFTDTYLLDNPAVNQLQQTGKFPKTGDIDTPPVPYDPAARALSLCGKVPPQVVRGRVPRTVTGEIDPSKMPDFPSIAVQAIKAKVHQQDTHVVVRIYFHVYDENPNEQGYQDLTNMIEMVAYYLTSFGQGAIDQRFPIILPLEWEIPDGTLFPHFLGEMHTSWQLPSARPLPDLTDTFIPMEHIDLRVSEDPNLVNRLWPNGS